MSGPESITTKQQPKLMNASELVNLLGHAGPASNIRVRINFKDGSVKEGIVKWHDDRTNGGPVIVIPDRKNPYNETLLPLGGHTVLLGPPRISSMNSARKTAPMFGKVRVHEVPINPDTKGTLFEIISQE